MSLMDGRRQGYRQSRSGSHDGHDHDHGDVFHSHAPVGKMKVAFLLTLFILVVEFAGGLLSHSLALLSDAGHVLTDIAALGLSWYALRQAEKPSDERMTFGYHRSGILAALINGISLMLITLWILWEAFQRFQHPQPVQSAWMFAGAGVGLALNLYLGLGMHKDDNINVKSAVMHMLGDAAASAGVIAGGCVMLATKWYVVDPILSVLIAALIAFGAWRIVRQTLVVLMEGTPRGVSFQSQRRKYDAMADADQSIVQRVAELAKRHGVARSHIALAWLLQKAPVTAPIIGAMKESHLDDAVAALAIRLSAEEVALLEEPYVSHPVVGPQ